MLNSHYIWLGGLLFKSGGSNLQHATTLSFLLIVYACYIHVMKKTIPYGQEVVDLSRLINIAKSQVRNWITLCKLGDWIYVNLRWQNKRILWWISGPLYSLKLNNFFCADKNKKKMEYFSPLSLWVLARPQGN